MTKIEWTSETWNPIIGCSKVSPGCANCYAARMAARFASTTPYAEVLKPNRQPSRNGWLPEWNGSVRLITDRIYQPLRWRKPRMIFICSMGDLFHENVSGVWIGRVLSVMETCRQHTFQILTKRPARRAKMWKRIKPDTYPNVWLGTSCEDQKRADERIPLLLKTPAAVRFVSLEPLLGEIDLGPLWLGWVKAGYDHGANKTIIANQNDFRYAGMVNKRQPQLDWVIIGCESIQGKLGRECKLEWVEGIIEQCQRAGVPVFVKQLPINGKVSHNIKDWPGWARVRQMPEGKND